MSDSDNSPELTQTAGDDANEEQIQNPPVADEVSTESSTAESADPSLAEQQELLENPEPVAPVYSEYPPQTEAPAPEQSAVNGDYSQTQNGSDEPQSDYFDATVSAGPSKRSSDDADDTDENPTKRAKTEEEDAPVPTPPTATDTEPTQSSYSTPVAPDQEAQKPVGTSVDTPPGPQSYGGGGGGYQSNGNGGGRGDGQRTYTSGFRPTGPGQGQDKFGKFGDPEKKVFVGGLSWDTTDDDLYEYFRTFGEVRHVQVKYDPNTSRSRGFGFVEFATTEEPKQILGMKNHQIKGKMVECKTAVSREHKKVFVGGVAAWSTEEEITTYFKQFGEVEEIELPQDKFTGRRRNFAFIIFRDEAGADKCAEQNKHLIGDRWCDCKKATPYKPTPYHQQQQGGAPGQDGQMGGPPGGWGGGGGPAIGPQAGPPGSGYAPQQGGYSGQPAAAYGGQQAPAPGSQNYNDYYQAWYNYYNYYAASMGQNYDWSQYYAQMGQQAPGQAAAGAAPGYPGGQQPQWPQQQGYPAPTSGQ